MTEAETAAMQCLDAFMAAWNARDVAAWAATFNYPSVRIANGRRDLRPNVKVTGIRQPAARCWGQARKGAAGCWMSG